ncbi:MAG TPA: type IV secretory system conjugative DNA transfer family protein, partial [Stellaceae bacterium]|nr:type IV secretory system conjugative DNA transfer family protein [Stellaceae bacterium]
GHRLAPWLSHVMVSRQETARPLLTPGEVMQLPPRDELVLVSGLAPIRAKKLRYYEDANFIERVAAAPELSLRGYRDRPAPRPDDWGGQVRGADLRLEESIERELSGSGDDDEGSLQQQRHPALPEGEVAGPDHAAPPAGPDDEFDATDQPSGASLPLSPLGRAHAMNEGEPHRRADDDLLPAF